MRKQDMVVRQPSPGRDDAPERLLRRYLAGDDEAFGLLVERYEERLYAFIERMVGDGHLAEDVFQQTFVKVAVNATAYDGRASFSTWLFRIARNSALDELRKRRRTPVPADPHALSLESRPDAGAVRPLDKLALDEQAERVRAALADLPEEQREAFLLREEGDLDFAQIGDIQGCARETAKSRFRLAVEKLRIALGAGGGES
jgi:RNA polymerase sigma-70 factor (ECF subfamily)